MRLRAWLAIVILGLLSLRASPGPADAQQPASGRTSGEFGRWPQDGMRVLGQSGGAFTTLVVEPEREIAWLIVGPRVVALSLATDPPQVVGRSEPIPGGIDALAAGDGLVVARGARPTDEGVALWMLDASDPTWPRLRSSLTASGRLHGEMSIGEGVLAYGADNQIRLVQVADLDKPWESGTLSHGGKLGSFHIHGGRLHALWDTRIVSIALHGAGGPEVVSTWSLPMLAQGQPVPHSAGAGGRMFVRPVPERGYIIDLNPSGGPVVAADLHFMDDRPDGVVGAGSVYIAISEDWAHALEVYPWVGVNLLHSYDIRDPRKTIALPVVRLDVAPSSGVRQLAAGGRFVLGRDWLGAAHRWRVSEEPAPSAYAHWEPAVTAPVALASSGRQLVTVDLAGAIERYDGRDPNRPRRVGRGRVDELITAGRMQHVAADAGHIWAVTGDGHLLHVTADRTGPISRWEDGLFLDAEAYALAAEGERVWVAQSDGLHAYEPGVDGKPSRVGHFALDVALSNVSRLAFADGYLWLASAPLRGSADTLFVFDVRDPQTIHQIAQMPAGQVHALAVVGRRAYAVTWLSGTGSSVLSVIDASNVAQPRVVGSLDLLANGGFHIVVRGGTALVASSDGVRVIDVRVDAVPDEIGSVRYSGQPTGMAWIDDVVWVADRELGLIALQPGRALAPRITLPWLGVGPGRGGPIVVYARR